jgi:hypothetical protein
VSKVRTDPPPPVPSTMRIIGMRHSSAVASASIILRPMEASAAPPRTVKSSPSTTTGRPSILARPNTMLAGRKLSSAPSSA